MQHSKQIDIALLLLRLGFGAFMIIGHGWGKLLRLFSGEPIEFGDPIGLGPAASLVLAVFAEFLCSIFVILGLYTRVALIPLIITMLVAAFIAHGGDPFPRYEKALLYLIPFVALLISGPGWYSLDEQWRKKL